MKNVKTFVNLQIVNTLHKRKPTCNNPNKKLDSDKYDYLSCVENTQKILYPSSSYYHHYSQRNPIPLFPNVNTNTTLAFQERIKHNSIFVIGMISTYDFYLNGKKYQLALSDNIKDKFTHDNIRKIHSQISDKELIDHIHTKCRTINFHRCFTTSPLLHNYLSTVFFHHNDLLPDKDNLNFNHYKLSIFLTLGRFALAHTHILQKQSVSYLIYISNIIYFDASRRVFDFKNSFLSEVNYQYMSSTISHYIVYNTPPAPLAKTYSEYAIPPVMTIFKKHSSFVSFPKHLQGDYMIFSPEFPQLPADELLNNIIKRNNIQPFELDPQTTFYKISKSSEALYINIKVDSETLDRAKNNPMFENFNTIYLGSIPKKHDKTKISPDEIDPAKIPERTIDYKFLLNHIKTAVTHSNNHIQTALWKLEQDIDIPIEKYNINPFENAKDFKDIDCINTVIQSIESLENEEYRRKDFSCFYILSFFGKFLIVYNKEKAGKHDKVFYVSPYIFLDKKRAMFTFTEQIKALLHYNKPIGSSQKINWITSQLHEKILTTPIDIQEQVTPLQNEQIQASTDTPEQVISPNEQIQSPTDTPEQVTSPTKRTNPSFNRYSRTSNTQNYKTYKSNLQLILKNN